MMPFTRDALRLVRGGASAADLGWSRAFYERICRLHGVAPMADAEPPPPAVDISAVPLKVDVDKRCAKRGDALVYLGPAEAAFLKALMNLNRLDASRMFFLEEICTRAEGGFSVQSGKRVFKYLAEKLKPLGATIASKKGVNGGYRFVDLLAVKRS